MRRIFGFAAAVLGLVLIFLSPLMLVYVKPRVEKAPTDVYDRSVSNGTGSYFNARTLSVEGPIEMRNVQIAKGDPEASTEDVAVISLFSRTINLDSGGDIDFSLEVFAMDRYTGLAVDCCGANDNQEGQTLKFPFDVQRDRVYSFYDGAPERAFSARYVRTEDVMGMEAYVFVSEVPQVHVGTLRIPGFLVDRPDEPSVHLDRFYEATTTLWVDPVTGAILEGEQEARQWLGDAEQEYLLLQDTEFANDEASVRATVDRVSKKVWQLSLVNFWVPVFGPIVGVALLVTAFFLVRGPRRVQGREVAAREPAPAPA